MIIKSMSRKAPTFGQLAEYIARGAETGSDPLSGFDCTIMTRPFVQGAEQNQKDEDFLMQVRVRGFDLM